MAPGPRQTLTVLPFWTLCAAQASKKFKVLQKCNFSLPAISVAVSPQIMGQGLQNKHLME
jgi:hypothetical protein